MPGRHPERWERLRGVQKKKETRNGELEYTYFGYDQNLRHGLEWCLVTGQAGAHDLPELIKECEEL